MTMMRTRRAALTIKLGEALEMKIKPSERALDLLRAQFTRTIYDHKAGTNCLTVPYSACETNAGTLDEWEALRLAKFVEPRNGTDFKGRDHAFSIALTEHGRKYLKGESI